MKFWFKFYLVICICSAALTARGQSWQSFGNPFDTTTIFSSVYDSSSGAFYFSGYMPEFNSMQGNYVWKWENTLLSPMGNSFGYGGTYKINYFNNELIGAGRFDSIGTRGFKMPIAKWDGLEWLPFDTTTLVYNSQGGSSRPHIDDMIVFENKLFVIGTFRY